MWFDLAVCHVARARSVISNVLYTHPQPFDDASQRFPCCGGARNAPGCRVRSLRQPEDLTQAQISIQFALSTLVSLKKAGESAWGGESGAEQQIEAMRIECRTLWEEYEKQKRVEETQREELREAGKPGEAAQDAEGLQTMRTLARNMHWMLHGLEAGREDSVNPEPRERTNFIR